MSTTYKLVSGNKRPAVKTDETIDSPLKVQPKLRLKDCRKTKLIKMERNFSFKREDVAKMVRQICDELGIEYPNKVKLSKAK